MRGVGGMFIEGETEPVSPLELAHCSQQPRGIGGHKKKGQDARWGAFQDSEQNVGVCGRNT